MTQSESKTEVRQGEAPSLRQVVLRIVGSLRADFSRGDLAALRRLNHRAPNALAFWQLLVGDVPDTWRRGEDAECRWALIIKGMALMVPHHFNSGADPGRVLSRAGFTELRLGKLLNARDGQFRDQFLRMCRYLAAKGEPVDWVRLAGLVLAEGRDETRAERERMAIARGFYFIANPAEHPSNSHWR